MRFPLQGLGGGLSAAVALCLCSPAQAGMQLQTPAAESANLEAAAPAATRPRAAASQAPVPAPRQDEKAAWSPCIRLINAAALGADVDAQRLQALRERCAF